MPIEKRPEQASCDRHSALPSDSDVKKEAHWEGGGTDEGAGFRCCCGSLLARYVGGEIELKCRRCKRTVIVAAPPLPHPSIS